MAAEDPAALPSLLSRPRSLAIASLGDGGDPRLRQAHIRGQPSAELGDLRGAVHVTADRNSRNLLGVSGADRAGFMRKQQRAVILAFKRFQPFHFFANAFKRAARVAGNQENRLRCAERPRALRGRRFAQIGANDRIILPRAAEQRRELARIHIDGGEHLQSAAVDPEGSPGAPVEPARGFIVPERITAALEINEKNGGPRALRQGAAQLLCNRTRPGSAVRRDEGEDRTVSRSLFHAGGLMQPACQIRGAAIAGLSGAGRAGKRQSVPAAGTSWPRRDRAERKPGRIHSARSRQ